MPGRAVPELSTVRSYHQRSKHQVQRYAAGPETLDWEAQPSPWRHWQGAPVALLPPAPADLADVPWPALFNSGAVPAQPPGLAGLGTLLSLGLGISAWKQQGPDRWAVRCNPSSGNLHPTEAYVLARGLPGLADGLYHHAPLHQTLERRALLAAEAGAAPGLWLGLASIHWREAWKYGERAFRYCQLDAGHAQGALRYAAAVLGWGLRRLASPGPAALASLLGLDRAADFGRAEAEEPEALMQVLAPGLPADAAVPAAASLQGWAGQANRLDAHPMYRWPVIDAVAHATRVGTDAPVATAASVSPVPRADMPQPLPAASLIRQRRSAQQFDRRAPMSAASLHALAAALQPAAGLPWDLWPAPARVHPVFFVHRVDGLAPGAYLLPRGDGALQRLSAALAPGLPWQPVPGSPLWQLAANPALAGTLRTLCCHQALASDANVAVALLAEFDLALAAQGPAGYRHLLQEAGLLGQVLYMEAEARGHQGTGIGCFFDDALHQLLGITGTALQSLYHFTLGTARLDPRITTLPPDAGGATTPEPAP